MRWPQSRLLDSSHVTDTQSTAIYWTIIPFERNPETSWATPVYQIESLCAQHTVRPINTKTLEKDYRFIKEMGGLWPKNTSFWKLSAAPLKAKGEGWAWWVVVDFLFRSLVPEVRSWSGNDVPVNLYQMNVLSWPERAKLQGTTCTLQGPSPG